MVDLRHRAALMANRKTEVKLVADLLMQEAEDVEELAKRVIDSLDQDRRKRDSYVIRASVGSEVWGIGPYPTRGAAERVAVQLRPDLPEDQVKGAVVRLVKPAVMEDDLAPRLNTFCPECSHPMVTHDWPKAKIKGCVIGGCLCGKPTEPPV